MNGFVEHGLDEDAFGEKRGVTAGLRTFDAFPKTKPSYTTASRRGGQWTVLILCLCTALAVSELYTWLKGQENHYFSVEKGVSRELQLNLDLVVAMPCNEIRVNVQDAAGDHIIAGELLDREKTSWAAWARTHLSTKSGSSKEYQTLHAEDASRLAEQELDTHVAHVLGEVRAVKRRNFPKGPKLKGFDTLDSCRVFGTLVGNKVMGDFQITARGHGYFEPGSHLDHQVFNFSHLITELSFGPHYPTLQNPLDKTISTTPEHFYRYQYFLSAVPTIYTRVGIVDPYSQALPDPSSISRRRRKNTIFTNQYAVTSQSRSVSESRFSVPGIFFKYDIEPILLVISEERGSLLALLVRLVNVISGVLVTGGWLFLLNSWAVEVLGRRKRTSDGVLTGRHTD